jgi:hypothetical protein
MKRLFSILLGGLLLSATLAASAAGDRTPSSTSPPIISWQAPAFYTSPHSGRTALTDAAPPMPYIPLVPCREYDSRNTTALVQAITRTVPLSGAPCGVPTTAVAVAINITIFNIFGASGNCVFKVDTVDPPATAWINYPSYESQRGNAGVVSTTGAAAIVVGVYQGGGSVDFTVDVFGYYGPTPANTGNTFTVILPNATTAILGESLGGGVGVYGNSLGAGGRGVLGYNDSATGYGVEGVSGFAVGVYGGSTNNVGVFGLSNNNVGVQAVSTNYDGLYVVGGRHGTNSVSTATSGVTYGVIGKSSSTTPQAAGVFGQDYSAYNPQIFSHAIGVLGSSQDGFGVFGESRYISVYGQLHNSTDTQTAYGLLGTSLGTALDSTLGPWAVFAGGNFGATGSKHFVEPHPTDPKKDILYTSLEGREAGTYFRGTASIVDHQAVIVIPEDFRIVTDEEGLTVQVTPIGAYSQVYVESQDLNQVVIRGSRDVQFHYMVNGVRRAFKNFEPVQTGYIFMPQSPSDRMPLYLTEEAKKRLISNGTYNPDGTVNMTTAERAGFTKIWAEREAEAKAASEKAAAAVAATVRKN